MTTEPFISVVTPAYNSEKTIERTIRSVLNQSYKNFEFIIIDDNSSDNTVKLIEKFDDNRIKLYKNDKNLGFHGNWNEAISKATGEYIKLIPDDDTLEKDALLFQVNILQQYQNVIMVGSKRNIIDEFDKKIMTRGKAFCNNTFCTYNEALKYIVRYGTNPIGEPGAVLFRASVLNHVNQFSDKYTHYIDLDFYIKVLKYGDYYFINKPLSNFRVWSRSYSVTSQDKHLDESIRFFTQIKKENDFLTIFDMFLCKMSIYKNKYLKYIFYNVILKYNMKKN